METTNAVTAKSLRYVMSLGHTSHTNLLYKRLLDGLKRKVPQTVNKQAILYGTPKRKKPFF